MSGAPISPPPYSLPSGALPSPAGAAALALRPWRLDARALLARLDDVVAGSLLLVAVAIAAVGMALGDQAARQAVRLIGDLSFLGPEYIVLGIEEFGPLIVALTLAQRVGAGFAAEVATLQSEDTLDAFALYGLEPARRVLAPMAVALVTGAVALGIVGFVVWELAGILTLWLRSGMHPLTFFHPEAVTLGGLLLLVLKCASYGALVFISATRAGLAARGGAEAVGRAATEAVVMGVVLCLAASLAFDVVWFIGRSP